LPEAVFDQVFVFVLGLLEKKGLLRGKAVAIDATTLEANAAMKSIVRKDTGQDWKEYLPGTGQSRGPGEPDGGRFAASGSGTPGQEGFQPAARSSYIPASSNPMCGSDNCAPPNAVRERATVEPPSLT